jgi:alpha-beta hydrolase superfamily lysophospholipase
MSATKTRFRYAGADGTALAGFLWRDPDVQPRGVLQLAHGAGEHAGRYFGPLAPVLAAGWAVYAADHRGHGLTSGMGDFGPAGARGPRTRACRWC